MSELSHKLGTADGHCRSMDEELARLQSQNMQLSRSKSERDVEANELQAKLRSADEKVLRRADTTMMLKAAIQLLHSLSVHSQLTH